MILAPEEIGCTWYLNELVVPALSLFENTKIPGIVESSFCFSVYLVYSLMMSYYV